LERVERAAPLPCGERVGVRGSMRALPSGNVVQDPIEVLQYLVVPETEHAVPLVR
jgi:hypothetical protein